MKETDQYRKISNFVSFTNFGIVVVVFFAAFLARQSCLAGAVFRAVDLFLSFQFEQLS